MMPDMRSVEISANISAIFPRTPAHSDDRWLPICHSHVQFLHLSVFVDLGNISFSLVLTWLPLFIVLAFTYLA